MALGLPLVAWGDAEDVSTWSHIGTCGATSGQTDPFGGTNAYLLTDGDAGSAEARYKLLGAVSGSTLYDAVWVKAGSATASAVQIYDLTATTSRTQIGLTWSGGVPSASTLNGTGVVLGVVAGGGGWYLLVYKVTGITSGNSHRRYFYPSGVTASATGTAALYVRNTVLLDYLDTPIARQKPREGSQWVQSASGVEDSWIVGPDYELGAQVRWVPTTPQATPVVVSGWDGRNEATGVNCGVAAMLAAGRQKQTLTFVPDRSACTTYIDSYLAEPMTEAPTFEANNGPYRTFPILLRNASTPYEGIP